MLGVPSIFFDMLKRNQYAGLLCMDLLQPLGIVVQGSLSDGLQVRLNGEISVEDMRVGKFLVVHGQHTRFFCILTDVTLGIASPRILMNPPDPENTFFNGNLGRDRNIWDDQLNANVNVCSLKPL